MNEVGRPTRGELGIRAQQRANRLATKRPASLNEAVSNKMDETLARRDAANFLRPPEPEELVRGCGEAILLALAC